MDADSSPPIADAPSSPTVLVVEDESSIRAIIKLSLEMKGYRVLSASEGAEALQLAEQHPGPIDLVITDILLPGMSGSDVVRALLTRRPGLHVIYISGFLGSEEELTTSRNG